ncbi:hypothetical protein OIU84_015470 [Salix udensis]|uniref:Uncharacterized protein n=1 Tax=Salix udensis TaxID=889485 RepID=A0AAD6JEA2_9ROSI|nr:hypothetical protein OIU84_015470 [Salix udensis]
MTSSRFLQISKMLFQAHRMLCLQNCFLNMKLRGKQSESHVEAEKIFEKSKSSEQQQRLKSPKYQDRWGAALESDGKQRAEPDEDILWTKRWPQIRAMTVANQDHSEVHRTWKYLS